MRMRERGKNLVPGYLRLCQIRGMAWNKDNQAAVVRGKDAPDLSKRHLLNFYITVFVLVYSCITVYLCVYIMYFVFISCVTVFVYSCIHACSVTSVMSDSL